MEARREPITIEHAKLMFRNFSGKQTQYNPAGRRNFCVVIPNDMVKIMSDAGWNLKMAKSRDDQDEPVYYIPVAVRYDNFPPKVFMITSESDKKVKTPLTEETIANLDYAELENVDLTIVPSFWDVGGRRGLKAYLRSMYATVYYDDLDSKYANYESLSSYDALMAENQSPSDDDIPF